MTDSSSNASEHNLDLSLGNLASKPSSREFGDNFHHARDQHSSSLQFELEWQRRGLMPKVYNEGINALLIQFD